MQRSKDKLLQLAQQLQEAMKVCGSYAVVICPCMIVIVPQRTENSNQKYNCSGEGWMP